VKLFATTPYRTHLEDEMRRVGTVRRATDYVVGGIALLLASIAVRPADAFAEVAPVTEDSLSAGLEAALSIAEDVDVDVDGDEVPPYPD